MRLLIFTTDLPPTPTLPVSGIALRTYGIGEAFRALGWEVLYSVPRTPLGIALGKRSSRAELLPFLELSFDSRNADAVVRRTNPDLILCGHWPAWKFSAKPKVPVIVDLAGPHLIERAFQGAYSPSGVARKVEVLSQADGVIFSSSAQARYFEPFFERAGRRVADLVQGEVPMVFSNHPEPLPPNDIPRILFSGFFLPWQNPVRGLLETAALLEERGAGELLIIGGEHPTIPIPAEHLAEVRSRLSQNRFVRFSPPIPYADLLEELRRATLVLDLMERNLERELAVPIRTCVALNQGVPVLTHPFSPFSQSIVAARAGWGIAPDEQIGSCLSRILDSTEEIQERRRSAHHFAVEHFSIQSRIVPLLKTIERELL